MPRAALRSMREHHHMSAIQPNSLAAACAALLAPLALAQTDVNATMQHGGVTRSYIVRLPPGFSAEDRAPLVVALHPSVSTGADFKATSGWDGVSNTHGLVVVYPTGGQPVGTNGKFAWNDWSFSGAAPDDLSFLDALIARVQTDFGTDACRTYMTGFSNGAMMTNSFVAVHADKVAAIAPVSGGWITAYGGSEAELTPALPVPVWTWRGSNETFVTGVGKNSRSRTQQDQEQLAFWIEHNNAVLTSTVTETLNYGVPRTYITKLHDGDARVWFTEVQGTGHLYQPGAADLIWTRFFSQIVAPSPKCAPCPADIDQSGAVDGGDMALLLGAWGTTDANADLDGSGLVGAGDLSILLAAWGPC
jgi:polyhydroxybutyrate depolymerase